MRVNLKVSNVSLKNINKNFGEFRAVKHLNLEIQHGEFFSLLGPSGCGKTTTLRMIAGFEFPSSGSISFDGKDVSYTKPHKRNTGMVFQNFALFPHMSVCENIAFGLQARKIPKPDIIERVAKALTLVDLTGLGDRKVTDLSGGQQQRVALARAIIIEPNILLLDEPLSNLDTKLREETREEIKKLQQRLGITTVYVTHDQEEALSLSNRMAVMSQGVCQQVGTPEEIYQNPANTFVAQFVGNANIIEGVVEHSGNIKISPNWQFSKKSLNGSLKPGQKVSLSIRPESFVFENKDKCDTCFDGKIKNKRLSGAIVEYQVEIGSTIVQVRNLISDQTFERHVDDTVLVAINPSKINILNAD